MDSIHKNSYNKCVEFVANLNKQKKDIQKIICQKLQLYLNTNNYVNSTYFKWTILVWNFFHKNKNWWNILKQIFLDAIYELTNIKISLINDQWVYVLHGSIVGHTKYQYQEAFIPNGSIKIAIRNKKYSSIYFETNDNFLNINCNVYRFLSRNDRLSNGELLHKH